LKTYPNPADSTPAAPRRFFLLAGLLLAASFLNYLDRQTLSVLKPTIKAQFGLDDSGYAILVNAFTFTYAAAYIGSGWLVERLGVRLALTIGIAGWSLAAIGSGLAGSFFALATFRALLGLIEPVHFPSTMRALTLWVPSGRRATWMSVCGAGGTLGAIAAVPLIAWLATVYSWHAAFIVPGLCGLVLAGLWWTVYRDPEKPAPTPTAPVVALPWTHLWRQRALWGIVLARFISDPVWYFCLFWMPGYFQEKRGLSLAESGFVGWIPFLAANAGGLTAAIYSDRLGRRWGNPLKARVRLLAVVACLGPLAILTPYLPGLGLTLAVLSGVGVVCLTWLFILGPLVGDVFPAGNVASVWAIAGAFGATGAIIFNYGIGQLTSTLGNERMFLLLGLLHPIAAVVLVSLVKPLKSADAIVC
jgi:ACS family hexuronate transporter-like MFS transporter